jgi:hypothetical protein
MDFVKVMPLLPHFGRNSSAFFLVLPLIAAAFVAGCEQDSDHGPSPASLTITEVTPQEIYAGTKGISVEVFPKDYPDQGNIASLAVTGNPYLLAGAMADSTFVYSPITIIQPTTPAGSYSIRADLFAAAHAFLTRWRTDGDYTVYLILTGPTGTDSYRKSTDNIHINGSVTVPVGSFAAFPPSP